MAAAPNASTNPKNGRNHSRLSFAKITDTLTVPDLLALQTESFDWLVGNDVWKARLAEGQEQGRTDLALHSGLVAVQVLAVMYYAGLVCAWLLVAARTFHGSVIRGTLLAPPVPA